MLNSHTSDANPFQQARGQAKREQLWSRLRRQTADLLCFQDVRNQLKVSVDDRVNYAEIPLQDIVDSVERCTDYTRSFLPLKDSNQQRWSRVKQAFLQSKPLPPIQVVQVGKAYFVIDGHHRVSVARQLGLSHLDAQVHPAQPQVPVDQWTCCT